MKLSKYVAKLINKIFHRNKTHHHECIICGLILAPYFSGGRDDYKTLVDDYGWNKFKNNDNWVCHHCACHGHDMSWNEWQETVKHENNKTFALMKEKDPEYYEYWFNGGPVKELFGEWKNGKD
jgi:hypothetical protein